MRFFLILFISFALPCLLSAGVEGIVTANRLNIRVRPATRYTKVAQLRKGDKVEILRHEKGWYEITAPQDAAVWISADFVKDGIVTKEVHLRAGPGVAFTAYRTAEKGESVKVLDSSRKTWLKIAPPYGLTAWVSAEYVYVTPENAAKLAGKPVTADKSQKTENKASEKTSESKTAADDKKDEPLPFLDSKGKIVTVEGYLVDLKNAKYVTHAVVSRINGETFPLCYVHSDTHNLKLWKGRRVTVTGLQRWVKGWQRPVVNLTKITPIK